MNRTNRHAGSAPSRGGSRWRLLGASVLCLTALAVPFLNTTAGISMAFDLSKFPDADAAREAFATQLPQGTSRDKVMHFLMAAEIKCFDDEAPVLACRVVEPSGNMVHVVWGLGFYFDPLRRLERIVVSRGLTGP